VLCEVSGCALPRRCTLGQCSWAESWEDRGSFCHKLAAGTTARQSLKEDFIYVFVFTFSSVSNAGILITLFT
jgi:hypothetical protein